MNERLCLRCDWTGEEKGAACPRCGALLYRPGDADPTATGSPAEPPREDASGHPWLPATAVDRPRAAAIVLASVVVAGIAFAVIYLNTPDPGEVLVGVEGSRSATPTGRETPTIDDPPSATSPSSPTEPGTCPDEPGAGIVAPTEAESAAAAVTADYRFEDSLLSSVGAAPALVEIGRGSSGFAHEAVLGQTRSVLRFDRGRGLSLTPTSGVIGSEEFTIELLFRFCHVAGYRKIIDLKDGSDDGGLYSLDGALNFYPRPPAPLAAIGLDTYAQVVLTRDGSSRVVGYVDGVRQFSFRDVAGRAVIDANDTLLFFRDDSTTESEFSGGAVARIRLYDRALTWSEVAALACTQYPGGMCG